MSIDTMGFEPRAFRMRGGSDTNTPRAPGKITAVHVHGATTAGETMVMGPAGEEWAASRAR